MDADGTRDLTPEQTEILVTFQQLSGLDDLEQCRDILEKSDWDTTIAVQHIFGEPDITPFAERGMGEGALNDINLARRIPNAAVDRASAPPLAISPSSHASFIGGNAPVERWGVFDWIKAAVAFPFRFVFTSLFEVFNFIWSLFAGPRFAPSTAVQDVQAFVQDFESKYGANHPVFYRGGYKEAYADAKRELRFLLLYLHQNGDAGSDRFCQDTLVNPEVVSLINSKALFWACSTKYSEGYKVAQALQASRFPSLGLIASKNNQMTLVGRLQGYHSPEQLIERLSQLFSANDRHLNAARMERRTLDQNQILRREQDEAYQKSLKADQDKERAKREEKSRKELEERRVKEAAEKQQREERLKGENLTQRKHRAANLVPSEPVEGHAEACRISVKFPTGERLDRRFLKTSTVGDLYNFIFASPLAPEHFDVFTTYPRKSIDCVPGSSRTIVSLGLGNSIAFIVEEKDLESDVEADRTPPPRYAV